MKRHRHSCGQPVISGIDDYARDIILDPTALSIVGEAFAILNGRRTWDYTTSRRHGAEAWKRNRWTIGKTIHGHLHTGHVCGWTPPAAWHQPAPAPAPAVPPNAEEAPF